MERYNQEQISTLIKENGWSIEQKRINNERENKYFLNGKKTLHLYLENHLCSQYTAYSLIEKDLRSIISWQNSIKEIISNNDVLTREEHPEKLDLIKALFVASVTFYGKCFTKCDGRRVKLEERDIIDIEYKDIHKSIMNVRNNLAAHSGAEGFEKSRVALVLNPNIYAEKKYKIFIELMQLNYFRDTEEDEFYQLVLDLQKKIKKKISILENKILTEIVEKENPLHWYTLSGEKKETQKMGDV